jgi:hypothetical protein
MESIWPPPTRPCTDFQLEATALTRSIFSAAQLEIEFNYVTGNGENYFESRRVPVHQSQIQVFVYTDEAGFFVDLHWYIFETQDYSSPEDLLERYGEQLRRAIAGELS